MDKRTFLFIILSILIWVAYIYFIAPLFISKEQHTISKEISPQSSEQDKTASTEITSPSPELGLGSSQVTGTAFQHPSNIIPAHKTLENDYFQATISNKGASIESFTLKQYQSAMTAGRLSLVNSSDTLAVKLLQTDIDLQNNLWEIARESNNWVKFSYTTPKGLVIYKTFSLNKYNYALDFTLLLANISANPITATLFINGAENIPSESYNSGDDIIGLHAYTGKENQWYVKEQPSAVKLKAKNINSHILRQGQDNVYWTGIANKYFAEILVPSFAQPDIDAFGFNLIEKPSLNNSSKETAKPLNLNFYLQTKEFSLEAGATKQLDFIFYAGPKKASELATLSHLGFDKLLSYWWFGFISKTLIFILQGLYGLFKNYGLAIIILTILIKVILFPVTKKGQVSMYRLQNLQPRIKALQEQYKNDKRKLGEEQLKLWKEYGVNPLSGCLPMLLQIPVFIGLYWALAQAIELRQAPFIWWITDLAQPDQLCKLPFPILGATYLHVLPLIMTISWLIQSLTQPKSPDPQTRQQQKLFIFMPLVFGILFYNVPSGLTLYWFASTLLGIVEQILIKKYYFR